MTFSQGSSVANVHTNRIESGSIGAGSGMPCIWGMWAETMSLRNLEIASAFYIAAALASMGCYASNYSCQGRTVNSNSGPPLCSLTLYGTGTCNGQDQLPLTGTNSGQGWQNPWEPFPIQIKGVAITTFQDPRKDLNQFEYIFAGNSYTPDIMAILGGARLPACRGVDLSRGSKEREEPRASPGCVLIAVSIRRRIEISGPLRDDRPTDRRHFGV